MATNILHLQRQPGNLELGTVCVCGSRLFEHPLLQPTASVSCISQHGHLRSFLPFRSMPPPSRIDYQNANMSSPTYTIAPPASIVAGIMSTNVPQAQTSLTTNMAAPPISNFQGVPPAVKGSTARKRKASAHHSLPQHRAGRSQLNPFNFVSTKEINIRLVFFPHVVCKFIFWFVKYTYSLNHSQSADRHHPQADRQLCHHRLSICFE